MVKSVFKKTINWNKHQLEVKIQQAVKPYFDYLFDPSFQEVNRLFVLSFPDDTVKTEYTEYFIPFAEIKDYNVMIDGQNIFDQPVKSNIRKYNNILKSYKEMITQPVAYYLIHISMNIIR